MNRRSFFGIAAAATVAAPQVAQAAAGEAWKPDLARLVGGTIIPFNKDLGGYNLHEYAAGESLILRGTNIINSPRFDKVSDRYVYRTGNPAIDALRSISGVHKALMEKRHGTH